jgi:hypothetical protein
MALVMRYLVLCLTVVAAALAAILATVALAASSSSSSASRAKIAVAQTSPAVITGAGFKRHERVAVTITSEATATKRVYASVRGGFRTMFRSYSIPFCTEYTVRAKGNRGSTAALHVIPDCPAMRQVETTSSPELPSDPGAPKKHR